MNSFPTNKSDAGLPAQGKALENPGLRLCWTRQALVKATGLIYRTLDASVRALFGDPAAETKSAL